MANYIGEDLATYDLDGAIQSFIQLHGEAKILDTGETVRTSDPLIYMYGDQNIIRRTFEGTLYLPGKKEDTFVSTDPKQIKNSCSHTHYIALFPSEFFLLVDQRGGYARCADTDVLYPIVAYGTL
ncbi:MULTISPECIES: hypothetical protein [Rhizobium/Agrobacterium group]|uniref:hypothetical protein n=1 Tax=Rhizobium/Agrobacterium group TaxID=227290 RepID=UPI001ADC3A03|nr:MULTISPECIES: hypothetical protein [Rhizobium/Agrobacterium group]MBO9112544.1 hypothetical protein [Agrobacterium sp. S2/73]QXZ76048.1 hypothetical protein J5276_28690 [Agrobacterium sp. S7/73]QYA16942.1 hypothetical protein J5284_32820 [Rhizobium sp. AB2/73]UEQ85485.1 hypothetical protein I8E17_31240 [Rhizobium sp. AB2/73]